MTALSLFGRIDRPASAVLFAGLGGSCEGIRRATGTSPIVAVNHCEHALWLHARNHPETLHLREDVWDVVPRQATRGRKLDLLWLSPDCTHHSRAKGGKPRDTGRRSLADVAIPWAEDVAPRVIMLENVPEWLDWGPLGDDGRPIPTRKGEFFRAWCAALEALGYVLEWRILKACDYGVPTSRRRVYLIARRDGKPIRWPDPTHGPGLEPYRTAAECIDWSIPCPSIFERSRPLALATERRIAEGLRRFVLNNPRPFIVPGCTSAAWLPRFNGGRIGKAADLPMGAVMSGATAHACAIATLVQVGYGERDGQSPRAMDIEQPLTTVVAGGQKHGLVTAWLAKHYGNGVTGQVIDKPLGTVTTADHHSLCTATLSPAETAGARRVAAFLVKYYGEGGQGQALDKPLDTVTTVDRFGLVQVTIEGQPYVVTDIGMRMLQPRELARAMGFDDSYILEGTKAEQVARVGNAVCPGMARALVEVNL